MVTALITTDNRFFFNVHSHVGKGRANRLDDVEFVRLGYFCLRGEAPPSKPGGEALVAAIANVSPSGPFGPDLDAAIRAHQTYQGGSHDGAVSPIKSGGSSMSYGGGNVWLVVIYNYSIQRKLTESYPRLDRHPQCGSALRQACRDIFTK